ncbi:LAGLIDADG family homing endonuclease [Halobacillus salinus]|nr:LAGLIDADG family homing endonuclease [Halobacillus salinus]
MSNQEIKQMYESGERTVVIAEMANVSPRYIRDILKKEKVEMRERGSRKRKYKVNEHFFKTWSNNMAYILGFFAADGYIASNLQLVSFAQKEKYILEEIRKEMDSEHPITLNPKTKVHVMNINSKIMKNDLMQIHGMTSEKSNTLVFPNIPEEYVSHFVRGYFDGDGYVNLDKYYVSIVSGSHEFLKELENYIEKLGIRVYVRPQSKYSRMIISGRKSIRIFANWMYQSSSLHLNRKRKEFERETLADTKLEDRNKLYTSLAIKERKERFLQLIKNNYSIRMICEELNIKEETFHVWMRKDEKFRRSFQNIR